MKPAEQIRAYLSQQGQPQDAPLYHLLTSWAIEEPTDADRERIERDLRTGGVSVEPPLNGLGPEATVRLSLIEDRPAVKCGVDSARPAGERSEPVLVADPSAPSAPPSSGQSSKDPHPGKTSLAIKEDFFGWWKGLTPTGKGLAAVAALATLVLMVTAVTKTL